MTAGFHYRFKHDYAVAVTAGFHFAGNYFFNISRIQLIKVGGNCISAPLLECVGPSNEHAGSSNERARSQQRTCRS